MSALRILPQGNLLLQFFFWATLVFVLARFSISGIWIPFHTENIEQVWEEFAPLRDHLETGAPIEISNPRQYGPVFFLLCEPLWHLSGHQKPLFAKYLYGFGLFSVAASIILVLKTIRWSFPEAFSPANKLGQRNLLFATLVIWLGSSPILYILNVKNVETWELFLISLGLYARIKNKFIICGLCIALATLIKILPIVFILYFLIYDRKVFFASCLSLLGLLIVFTFYYGTAMGVLYPLLMAKASIGNTWGAFHMENLSVKGYVLKIFCGWQVEPNSLLSTGLINEKIALFWSQVCQFLGGLCWLTILCKGRTSFANIRWSLPWEWAWVGLGILVLSPQTAFEYATLAQGSFSFCAALWLLLPFCRSPATTFFFFMGAFLVLNIVPRNLVNHMLLIPYLNEWSGNRHLTASEGYQLYGFPLFGFISFMVFMTMGKFKALKERPVESV